MKYVFIGIFSFIITFLPWTIKNLAWFTIIEILIVTMVMIIMSLIFDK